MRSQVISRRCKLAQVRSGLSPGGKWIRTSGSARDCTTVEVGSRASPGQSSSPAARPRLERAADGGSLGSAPGRDLAASPERAHWSSGLTMICCSAGLSGSASRTRCGMRQPSPRTVTGCSKAISPRSFSLRFCRRRKSKPCCRVSTSRSTGPCSKPGRVSKASGRRTVRASLPARDAILVRSRRSPRAGTFQLTQKVALRRPNSWIRSARCR
jgi:hypothetical protein